MVRIVNLARLMFLSYSHEATSQKIIGMQEWYGQDQHDTVVIFWIFPVLKKQIDR